LNFLKYVRVTQFIGRHWVHASFLILSLLCYASSLIPPASIGLSAIVSFLIPVVICIQFILLPVSLFRKSYSFVFPLIGLVAGAPYIFSSISFHAQPAGQSKSISILSYNAKLFRTQGSYGQFSMDMIRWVAEDTSDIKCIQEFSTSDRWEALNIKKQIEAPGYYSFSIKSKMKDNEHDLGMAIFSKSQILNSGVVWEDTTSLNAIMYVDLNIAGDTLRIYNVHLTSMNIDRALKMGVMQSGSTISKLVGSSIKRSDQIDALIRHTKLCPFRFVICGDFNETPYGYNYQRLKREFRNSFESAGNGFGFTYNSRFLPLRIDHQFYTAGVAPLNLSVDKTNRISDHFPLRGLYILTDRSR